MVHSVDSFAYLRPTLSVIAYLVEITLHHEQLSHLLILLLPRLLPSNPSQRQLCCSVSKGGKAVVVVVTPAFSPLLPACRVLCYSFVRISSSSSLLVIICICRTRAAPFISI